MEPLYLSMGNVEWHGSPCFITRVPGPSCVVQSGSAPQKFMANQPTPSGHVPPETK